MTSQAQKKKTDPAKQVPKPKPAVKSKLQSEAVFDAKSSHSTPSTLGKLLADIKGKSQAMISEISG